MTDETKHDIPGTDLKIPPEPERWGFQYKFDEWCFFSGFLGTVAKILIGDQRWRRQMCAAAEVAWRIEAERLTKQDGFYSSDRIDAIHNAEAWRKAGNPEERSEA